MYVVTVEFVAKPERAEAFREAMVENARTSREHEPGCRQFDVCAFDAHCSSAHFLAFDHRVRDWVDRKTVRIYEQIDP